MPTYPGTGQATLLNPNTQKFFCKNERLGVTSKTIAFQLQRTKGMSYPWGAAIEVKFSASPGTFQIDIEGAETDQTENYIKISSTTIINAVNASFVGRYDLVGYYPKFVRLGFTTFPNDVLTTAVITR